MERIDDTSDLITMAAADAMASTMAGGQAYVADVARRLAPSVPARRPATGSWRTGAACSVRPSATIVGRWRTSAARLPDGCQYVLSRADGDADAVRDELRSYGLPHLGDCTGVWVLDETGFLKNGEHAAGSPASTAARRARSSSARSACCCAMPAHWAMRWWIGSCLCPTSGPTRRNAAGRRGFRASDRWPPSRSWRRRCWPGPSRLACQPHGSPATAWTGIIAHGGHGWKPHRRPMSWRSRARKMWGLARSSAG